jgi:Lrp/AsnC family transcriptional regulator, leucine-responsive regulatory protein
VSESANASPVRHLGPLEVIDRAILRELVRDGRCTLTELADRVGLSVSAVHQRVRRLEQRGAVNGYTARLDLDQLNLPLTALISLTPIDPAAPDDYPNRLQHLSQIESCYSVAGNESYILLVRVASPLALEDLLRQIRESANVSTRTTVVLSTPFEGRPPAV